MCSLCLFASFSIAFLITS
uniref:Uncharacterized protein n=1 Tax=Arundo donax TaxID=35708 RepID=A0A0A9HAL3_ARUDO